jgi:hypothetical protein
LPISWPTLKRKTSQNINHAPNKNQIFYHDQNVGRVASGHNPNNPKSLETTWAFVSDLLKEMTGRKRH